MTRALGIDLGTTYSVAATVEAGRPRLLPNAEGRNLTPSVVALTDEALPLVGDAAKRFAEARPEHVIFSIKRRMGSRFRVQVGRREYSPEQISGIILRKMKADAELRLGERVDQAVITVPAYFNDRQRQATLEAATLAGLRVPRILNEPTAAALAYGLAREEVETVMVWDLGGGTFDVSILELGDGIFEVRAVGGDTLLGGDDFDQRVMAHLAAAYRQFAGASYPEDLLSSHRLKTAAEAARIALSFAPQTRADLPLPGSPAGASLPVDLTRELLSDLAQDLLQRVAAVTEQTLNDSGLAPERIDRLILAGGATRMPAIRELAKRLTGRDPYRSLDPDTVVAIGAAIQAGMLLGEIDKVALLDVLPLSLGVETLGGLTATLIARNTPLPASEQRIFTTAADWQTTMDIEVLQGERALAADNISLGRFQLTGIPRAARGVPKVEVAVDADVDGIVHVSATDLLTETEVTVTLATGKQLDGREIDDLAREAQQRAAEDEQARERIRRTIEAENLIVAAARALDDPAGAGRSRQVAEAVHRLEGALASDHPALLAQRCDELRALLSAWQEPVSSNVSGPIQGGEFDR